MYEGDLLVGQTLLGMDTATAFYPWYSFLGEQLRAGHIPTWNPHQFSGTPFAADPESGWMYLPAMLAFTLLPLQFAARLYQCFHIVLAAFSMYALARTLGTSLAGGVLAGLAYACSGFFLGHTVCCFAYSGVAAWLPLVLFGAERSLRPATWPSRGLWWGVAGLALSQIVAAWVGQATYYTALVLGSFLAYRTLAAPGRISRRLGSLALNGGGIGVFAFGLAAAGLLPRVEYNLLSNLPGGYPDAGGVLSAPGLVDWGVLDDWQHRLFQPGFYYAGWTTLGLSVAGLLARRRSAAIFFLCLAATVLVLARLAPTPLHALFGLLPGFERIHARSPERAMLVFYLAPALLAGIGLSWLQGMVRRRVPASRWASLVVACLAIGLVGLDLRLAWSAQVAEALAGRGDYQFTRVDLPTYFAPSAAATFLQTRAADRPFRYFGYAQHFSGGTLPYTLRWTDHATVALEVNNRALVSGLEDIQGYNPVHLARYDRLMAALNGMDQNYHHADVLPGGLSSPLLDLLNVRYVIVPSVTAQDQLPPRFDRLLRVVYADDTVHVLENPSALPRAWLVHAAREVAPGEAAKLLAETGVDPRQTALLEAPPPRLSAPADLGADQVHLLSLQADRLSMRASSTADSLLVLSEMYYPAWQAYVDGQEAQVYVADEALRAVALPAGEHLVEFLFESIALPVGLLLSLVSASTLAALAAYTAERNYRARWCGGSRCKSGAVPQL